MATELIAEIMCEGCGWVWEDTCKVIKEPQWIDKQRNGQCFAKATPERVKEIEAEIRY